MQKRQPFLLPKFEFPIGLFPPYRFYGFVLCKRSPVYSRILIILYALLEFYISFVGTGTIIFINEEMWREKFSFAESPETSHMVREACPSSYQTFLIPQKQAIELWHFCQGSMLLAIAPNNGALTDHMRGIAVRQQGHPLPFFFVKKDPFFHVSHRKYELSDLHII